MDKPKTAKGYPPEWLEGTRAACLYVATVLGDLLVDDLIVVGGLVPSLLIAQDALPEGASLHPGTMDLDLGLKLGVLDGAKYTEIANRLRHAGFEVKENESGNRLLHTWLVRGTGGQLVTVDFLISPSSQDEPPSSIKHLEGDFGAVVTPGLELAFRDREIIAMEGLTVRGEQAARDIPVCGPGAFVVLKALAFRNRGEAKDAYDLYYVVRNFGAGVGDVASRLSALLPEPETQRALSILREDFVAPEHLGPARAARFVGDEFDDALRQDVVAFVAELLNRVDR